MNEQLLIFAHDHILMVGLLVAVVIAIVITEVYSQLNHKLSIQAQELAMAMNHNKIAIIDVRPKELFTKSAIVKAHNMLCEQKDIDQMATKLARYKNDHLVIIDANGDLAAKITAILARNNFSKVKFLAGGMNAWQKSGLPTIQSK
jgi:rhodanese-related sulfurtransferase